MEQIKILIPTHVNPDTKSVNTLFFENICKFIKENIKQDEFEKKLEGNMPKIIYERTIAPTKKLG